MKDRQIWYLPKTTQIETMQTRRLTVVLIVFICGIIVALGVWASFLQFQEIAFATGEVAPVERVSVVGHLEGGTIRAVLVEEGDYVKKGQVLAEVDATVAKAELQQLEAKALALRSDEEREKALMEKAAFTPTSPMTNNLQGGTIVSPQAVLKSQENLYQEQMQALAAQQSVFQEQIFQKEGDLVRLSKGLEAAKKNVVLRQQEYDMYNRLVTKGYVSKLDVIRAKRELNTEEAGVTKFEKDIDVAKNALQEAKNKLIQLNKTEQRDAGDRLRKAQQELFSVQYQIKKLKYLFNETTIRSPIDGTVFDLKVTKDQMIPTDGILMSVVPVNVPLRAEIRIQPTDVGFIRVGNSVLIKVDAYNFTQFGGIKGKLTLLSPTVLLDEKKQPYYQGFVSLEKNYVGSKANQIIPGMTVTADIITGGKSLLSYILKPVRIFGSKAFHEK